jgi:hypothetical protein
MSDDTKNIPNEPMMDPSKKRQLFIRLAERYRFDPSAYILSLTAIELISRSDRSKGEELLLRIYAWRCERIFAMPNPNTAILLEGKATADYLINNSLDQDVRTKALEYRNHFAEKFEAKKSPGEK